MYMKSFITVVIIVTLIISGSCQNGEITGPIEKKNTIFSNEEIMNLEVENTGEIHNQILAVFDSEHDLLSGEKLCPEEFITLAVKSMNTVFRQEKAPFEVNREDIIYVLSLFAEFRERKVYDFFAEQKFCNVESLFHYLEKNMDLSKESSAKYLDIIENINRDDKLIQEYKDHGRTLCLSSINKNDGLFIDILTSSHDFWESKAHAHESKCNFLLTGEIVTDPYDPYREKGRWWSDTAGGILGLIAGGSWGAAIVGPLASITFTMVYNNPNDWNISAYPHGRWSR